MRTDLRELTIDEIGVLEGFTEPHKPDKRIPLSMWFDTILNTKLKDLCDGDLAKMIRQQIYIQSLTLEALKRLKLNPIAGYLGDGELLESIASVKRDTWIVFPETAKTVLEWVEEFLALFHTNQLALPEDQDRFSGEDREEYLQNLVSIKANVMNEM